MVDSSVDVCDLMIELLCEGCPDSSDCLHREEDGSDVWSHSKLMDCIRKPIYKVGIHAVDDEGNKHYEEITIADTKEYGRWTQTVTKIEILRMKEEDLIGSEYGYHCEACLERGVTTNLNYGDEVNVDGRILCKDCAAEEKP